VVLKIEGFVLLV